MRSAGRRRPPRRSRFRRVSWGARLGARPLGAGYPSAVNGDGHGRGGRVTPDRVLALDQVGIDGSELGAARGDPQPDLRVSTFPWRIPGLVPPPDPDFGAVQF